MKLVCWNCRGVGGPRAVRSICDVVNTHRPSILGLLETKKADGNWDELRCRLGFKGCLSVRSRGKAGGLALLWKDDVGVDLKSFSYSHIDVWVKGEEEFFLTVFYGNPRVQDRIQSWNLLRKLRRDEGQAWAVMGDFNEVLFGCEMEGKRDRPVWQMDKFRHCLNDCGLSDLGSEGGRFTYSNRRLGAEEVRARLDRVVVNQAWRDLFPNATVRHSIANYSDHLPIVLSIVEKEIVSREKIIRFEPMWLRHKDFKEIVKRHWEELAGESDFAEKLRRCMEKLNGWNWSTFGSVRKNLERLKERLQHVRSLPRTKERVEEEAQISDNIDEWLEREELLWRQRSRAEWLNGGDRNTSFFHAKASQRRRRNLIRELRNPAGEVCSNNSDIHDIITNYFSALFSSQVLISEEEWKQAMNIVPKVVTDDMNEMLIAPFTEAEVRKALFQMHPTKAPGVDGLSALFYQSNWEIVGGDVVKEVLKCLNEGILNSAVNETLIVLIPKVHKVERVEDLRPISLCNVIMKIITKVLANRLKTILATIISPSQSAFIKGWLITDNIIVAHEVAHFIKGRNAQKKGFLSLKLDLSKAYDRVEWHFVKEMMLKMGFADAWVNKIMLCISTVSYKIRINGSTSEAVYPMRGLRQGDPISPYLFVICTEWLSHAIHIQQRQGIIEGIRICKNAPTITHLMFADDCLIFSKATREAVVGIKGLLKTYELVAGQKVNYSKSEIVFSKNVAGVRGRSYLIAFR
ncbi:unnamed protein product [Rhodiola kirilowii]